jgi:hypothetical protein
MKARYFLFDTFAINELKRGVTANEIVKELGIGMIKIGIVHPEDEMSLLFCMKMAISTGTFLEITFRDYETFLMM